MSSVVKNLIIDRRLVIASIGLALAVLAGCCWLVRSSARNDMLLTELDVEDTGRIPPIDAAAPERTEKAIFALG